MCLRGCVYFPCCFPILLTLSATSKSGEMSYAFSLSTTPQPKWKHSRWQPSTWTFTLLVSSKVKGGLKPNTSQTRLAVLHRKVEECHSLSAVGKGHLLQGDVHGSCWIYGLPFPSVMWPEWINQTPDRQQLVLLQIMFSPICLQYL